MNSSHWRQIPDIKESTHFLKSQNSERQDNEIRNAVMLKKNPPWQTRLFFDKTVRQLDYTMLYLKKYARRKTGHIDHHDNR